MSENAYKEFFELTILMEELERIEQWLFDGWIPNELTTQNLDADSELAACQASVYRKIIGIKRELSDG